MSSFTVIFVSVITGLLVLLAAWLVLNNMLKEERARREFELRRKDRNITTPIRMRAYERLALLMERITPEHLLLNLDISSFTISELQQQLLQTVRLEFEHNLSQQIYVSDNVWAAVVIAKEEMLRYINTVASRMGENDNSMLYAQQLLTTYALNGETPTQKALQLLNEEARSLM